MALRPLDSPYVLNRAWAGYGPVRIALGLMTPRRKLASSAYFPGPRARLHLRGAKMPYWQVINYSLDSRESGDSRVVTGKDFTLVALMGNSDQAGESFRTQFYHLVDKRRGFRFSRTGLNVGNALGNGADPFILRRPYSMPSETALLNRTQNLATVTNTIQVAAYGFMN